MFIITDFLFININVHWLIYIWNLKLLWYWPFHQQVPNVSSCTQKCHHFPPSFSGKGKLCFYTNDEFLLVDPTKKIFHGSSQLMIDYILYNKLFIQVNKVFDKKKQYSNYLKQISSTPLNSNIQLFKKEIMEFISYPSNNYHS